MGIYVSLLKVEVINFMDGDYLMDGEKGVSY